MNKFDRLAIGSIGIIGSWIMLFTYFKEIQDSWTLMGCLSGIYLLLYWSYSLFDVTLTPLIKLIKKIKSKGDT